jgi:ArsR family transcriptional regulator, arsenate/arsenite/antimonite-responsive transcriptional repressor
VPLLALDKDRYFGKSRNMDIENIAARLEALGNPTRLSIFRFLVKAGDPGLSVGQLQERIGIAASTLSHHLHKLVLVGLVTQERRSTVLVCRANFAMMRGLVDALAADCCADACPPALVEARRT